MHRIVLNFNDIFQKKNIYIYVHEVKEKFKYQEKRMKKNLQKFFSLLITEKHESLDCKF